MAGTCFYREQTKGCWKYYALTFVIWNALTVFWVCYSTFMGGIFAVLGNAFQMFVVFAVFRRVKKWFLQKGKTMFWHTSFLLCFGLMGVFSILMQKFHFPGLFLETDLQPT
jgi:Uri superfamily endonuclease